MGGHPHTGTSAAVRFDRLTVLSNVEGEVVFNNGFDGRGRPSYANGNGSNGQESPSCRAVFVA